MTYALWQRNRIGFLAVLGYFAAFSVLLAWVGSKRMTDGVLAIGMLFLLLSYLFLMGVFIHQDSDVGAAKSSYPSYMFTLPVMTGRLVIVPMILATLTFCGTGMTLSVAARFAGYPIPLLWPTALGATIVAVLQAIFWFPWGIPYAKLLLTVTALPAVCVGVGIASNNGAPEQSICMNLAIVAACSYAIAYLGVRRARRGDGNEFGSARPAVKASAKVRNLKPFRSPAQAQRWYEWRQHGIVLPAMAVSLACLFYVPTIWDTTTTPLTMLAPDAAGRTPTIPTYVCTYYPVLLFLIPCASWIMGCGAKRSDVKRGDRTFQLFYGTRPVSDADLVGAKLKSTAVSTLWAWGLLILLSLPILTMKGGYLDMQRGIVYRDPVPIGKLLPPFIDGRAGFVIACIFLLGAIITWRNYVIGFWTELSGRLWLRYAYPAAFGIAYVLFLVWGTHRTGVSSSKQVFDLFSILVWAALGLKLILALWLLAKEYRGGLLRSRAVFRSLVLYVSSVGILIAVAFNLSRPIRDAMREGMAVNPVYVDTLLAALILLWTPLTRILAAPLMLSINRHRSA